MPLNGLGVDTAFAAIDDASSWREDAAPPGRPGWPEPPDKAAFHGPAGELVELLAPKTEAAPVALLVNTLVMVGSMAGRDVYRTVDDSRHHPNLFVNLVGVTSGGAKGRAWSRVKRSGPLIDDVWAENCVQSGLSSGEGLIFAVRDPVEKTEPVREKGQATGEHETVITDPGVGDKRLLVTATEFAGPLKVARRQGSTLSDIMRQGWDGEDLRILNKNSPVKATGPHISILGHITPSELRRYMDSTEIANGFANRFIWICVRRAQFLAIPVNVKNSELEPIAVRFRDALQCARNHPGEREFSPECRQAWITTHYPEIARERLGMVGELLARGPAQVLRLALLYSILDSAFEIGVEHLNAALALWEYAERSVEYLFGDRLGDPEADAILEALRSQPNGLTRTQINNLFGRHLTAARLEQALAVLLTAKLATFTEEPTSGRPTERWLATNP